MRHPNRKPRYPNRRRLRRRWSRPRPRPPSRRSWLRHRPRPPTHRREPAPPETTEPPDVAPPPTEATDPSEEPAPPETTEPPDVAPPPTEATDPSEEPAPPETTEPPDVAPPPTEATEPPELTVDESPRPKANSAGSSNATAATARWISTGGVGRIALPPLKLQPARIASQLGTSAGRSPPPTRPASPSSKGTGTRRQHRNASIDEQIPRTSCARPGSTIQHEGGLRPLRPRWHRGLRRGRFRIGGIGHCPRLPADSDDRERGGRIRQSRTRVGWSHRLQPVAPASAQGAAHEPETVGAPLGSEPLDHLAPACWGSDPVPGDGNQAGPCTSSPKRRHRRGAWLCDWTAGHADAASGSGVARRRRSGRSRRAGAHGGVHRSPAATEPEELSIRRRRSSPHGGTRGPIHPPDAAIRIFDGVGPIKLELVSVTPYCSGVVWLRYRLVANM